jgi:hypothetical protein
LDSSFVFYEERTMFDPSIAYEIVKLNQRERLEKAETRRRLGKIQSRWTGTQGRSTTRVGKILTLLGLSPRA